MKKYLYQQSLILLLVSFGNVVMALPQTQRQQNRQAAPQRRAGITEADNAANFQNAPGVAVNRPQLQVQTGHASGINAVAFSPDGQFVVTGANNGLAFLWSTETGAEVHRFVGHEFKVEAVAISPKTGRFVATGSIDNSTRIWDLATAKQLLVFNGHNSVVYGVAFSLDERLVLTGSADNTAQLWERETGKVVKNFPHPNTVTSVAFAPDGQHIVTGCKDGIVRLWNLSTTGEPQLFKNPRGEVTAVALSADGHSLAVGGDAGAVCIWKSKSDATPLELPGHTAMTNFKVNSVAFSPDDKRLLSASWDGTARVWDAASGREIRRISHQQNKDGTTVGNYTVAAFSPDGRRILTGGWDYRAVLWDAGSGQELRRFQGNAFRAEQSVISPDGRWMAVDINGGYVVLWDLTTGRQMRWAADDGKKRIVLGKDTSFGYNRSLAFAFTADNRYLALAANTTVQLWDVYKGQAVQEFPKLHTDGITSIAFSPDGSFFVTGSWDKTAKIWNRETGAALTPPLEQKYPVHAVAVSPDSRHVLTGNGDDSVTAMFGSAKLNEEPPCEAILWDATTGNQVRKFYHPFGIRTDRIKTSESGEKSEQESIKTTLAAFDVIKGKVTAVAFSPDGSLVVTGNHNGTAHLWKTATGDEVQYFPGDLHLKSLAFTPDAKKLMVSYFSNQASIFDVATGTEIHALPHPAFVMASALTPDGRFVITQSWDNTSRVWSVATGKEVCRFISLYYGAWVVATPEGRFDANDLEEIRGLHWKAPDDPLNPLPVEVFMRDYYEPRLLARLLEGEKFAAIRDVSRLNRAQPKVEVTKIEPRKDAPDLVNVTVEVTKATHRLPDGTQMQSGVYDLRLFRDGQLIASEPQAPNDEQSTKQHPAISETLAQWQQRTLVALEAGNRSVVTFRNIRLPHSSESGGVMFSAYAFNEDRVKSVTAFTFYRYYKNAASPFAPLPGRAYLITIGVNAYESAVKDLTYAAKDARRLNETLFATLEKTKSYPEIIRVSLIADRQGSNLTEKTATRANIRAVLRLLAGKPVAPEVMRTFPDAAKLQGKAARPEDLIIISFSGHGEVDRRGNFYLLPYDIGRGHGEEVTDRLLASSISSLALSEWMKEIDAGEMVMIVDACHSAAAVKSDAFKPGPMGSRGLGQLAFDKKIKILAATQPEQKASERGGSRLIKALLTDGLDGRKADSNTNGEITLQEWLEYAVRRVPEIYNSAGTGNATSDWKSDGKRANQTQGYRGEKPQMPALFDFPNSVRTSPQSVVLVRRNS